MKAGEGGSSQANDASAYYGSCGEIASDFTQTAAAKRQHGGGVAKPGKGTACPATLKSLDGSAAEAMPGVKVVHEGNFIAVAAPGPEVAEKALAALKADWNPAPAETDSRGVCPLGQQYIFESINGSSDLQHTWATSCGGQGTFGGKTSTVITLFEKQIPDFTSRTSSVSSTLAL